MDFTANQIHLAVELHLGEERGGRRGRQGLCTLSFTKTVKGLLGESVGAWGPSAAATTTITTTITIIVKTGSSYASQTALKLLGLPLHPQVPGAPPPLAFIIFIHCYYYPSILLSSFLPSPPSSVKVDEVPRECVLLT